MEPEGAGIDLTFAGNAFDQIIVDGRVEAPRVSLDVQAPQVMP